jgi:tetratricopeptide (TPR) repeat protein
MLLVAIPLAQSATGDAKTAEESFTLRDILALWSSGSTNSGKASLDLFRRVRTALDTKYGATLARDESEIKHITREDPRAYLPILGLYRQAHAVAVKRQDGVAGTRFRLETTRLIEEFIKRDRSPQAPRTAARFFFTLALTLRAQGDLELALEELGAALDLDPDNAPFLHAAAAIYEKIGHYSTARARLERAVRIDPSGETRLRLALCQARSGQHQRADALLSALAEGSDEDWIRIIAFQERSQLMNKIGNPELALEIARAGLRHFPQDEPLAALAAFLAGPRDQASRQVVDRLTSRPNGREWRTPRGRYNIWPRDSELSEAMLNREIAEAMPNLERQLKRLATPEIPASVDGAERVPL